MVTVAESPRISVLPSMTESTRLAGLTAMTSGGSTSNVSTNCAVAWFAVMVMVMVSTYVPAARPLGLRVHRTGPLPVPLVRVRASHSASPWVAIHGTS